MKSKSVASQKCYYRKRVQSIAWEGEFDHNYSHITDTKETESVGRKCNRTTSPQISDLNENRLMALFHHFPRDNPCCNVHTFLILKL